MPSAARRLPPFVFAPLASAPFVFAVCMATLAAQATRAEPSDDAGDDVAVRVVTEHPQPLLAAATPRYQAVRLSSESNIEAILESLAKTDATLSFAETPLRDWIAAIGEKAGIDAGLDTGVLENAGIDLESPVSGSSAGRPLLQAIRSMLDPLGLAAVVRHGRLLVTTREQSQDPASLERVLYPILPGNDPEEVRDLIESTIAPETWDSVGGFATVRPLPAGFGSGLVVSQTEENHERIAALLGGIDRAIWNRPGGAAAARIVRTYTVSDPRGREELAAGIVKLCNDALPEGKDPGATVQVIGDSLVVQSVSRAFHVMAAAIITSIDGVNSILIEADEGDTDDERSEPAGTVQATSLRRMSGDMPAWPR